MSPCLGVKTGLSRHVKAIAAALLVCISALTAVDNSAWSRQGAQGDRDALKDAVESYFLAEISGDPRRVWEMLAPSSDFRKAYTYEFYEEMQRREGIRVISYTLGEVLEIKDNVDKKAMPAVDKVASVKVDVVLIGPEGKNSRHTIVLTFLRETGKWYKG